MRALRDIEVADDSESSPNSTQEPAPVKPVRSTLPAQNMVIIL